MSTKTNEMDLWIAVREKFSQLGGTEKDLEALLAQGDKQAAIGGIIAHCRQNPPCDLSKAVINIGWKKKDIRLETELEVLSFFEGEREQAIVGEIGFVSIADLAKQRQNLKLYDFITGNAMEYKWCSAAVALGFYEQPHLFPYSEACKAIFAGTVLQNKRGQKFSATYRKPQASSNINLSGEWSDQTYHPGKDNGASERTFLTYWK